jgi:hypothetical protein
MDQEQNDIRTIIHDAIQEFVRSEQARAEPAYKTELMEERKRREQLEQRLNGLVEENKHSRALAEQAERGSAIRAELQRLGVSKLDLAFRAVKDDVRRTEDGRLVARIESGDDVPMREYLTHFVADNPELLPARISGGSGASGGGKSSGLSGDGVDLDKIRPGMSPEELERVRQEISRVAGLALRGR